MTVVVAESEDKVVEKAQISKRHFVGDIFAVEFVIKGYVISYIKYP